VTIQESDSRKGSFREKPFAGPIRSAGMIKSMSVMQAAVQAFDVARARHWPGSRLDTFCQCWATLPCRFVA